MHMWLVTTLKYANATSGICIYLQAGLNVALGEEFPCHCFQLNINHICTVNEIRKKSSVSCRFKCGNSKSSEMLYYSFVSYVSQLYQL